MSRSVFLSAVVVALSVSLQAERVQRVALKHTRTGSNAIALQQDVPTPRGVCVARCGTDSPIATPGDAAAARRRRDATRRAARVEWLLDEAEGYRLRGDWANVIRSLEEALDGSPDDSQDIDGLLREARTAQARQARLRTALSTGDVDLASQLLREAMSAYGVALPQALQAAVAQQGAERLGPGGLQAVQVVEVDRRRISDIRVPVPLLRGDPQADRRFEAVSAALARIGPAYERALASARASAADARLRIEQIAAAKDALNMMRTSGTRESLLREAQEWGRIVIQSTIATAAVLPAGTAGENTAETVAFIRRMEQMCAFSKDPYCAAAQAYAHKSEGDPALYPSRRNAEHYLFAKAFAADVNIPFSATATVVLTPAYSIAKHAVPGKTFSTTPPSVTEVAWAYRGVIAGITGTLDPTATR